MRKMLSVILSAAILCFAFVGCDSEIQGTVSTNSMLETSAESTTTDTSALSGKLTLNGSTSMAKVCQALGEAFEAKYPGVTVEKAGTGSGDAAKAVRAGTAFIGDLSRNMKPEENPGDFEIVPIAIDGIAVAVNTDNKVSNLSSDQIAKIFTGEITNWKDVGGDDRKITVLGREAASGTRDGFESIFKCEKKCKYAAELSSTGEVVNKVGSDKGAIGYVSLDSLNNSIKAVDIDHVKANEENIVNGTYKAQRPFIEIYKKNTDSDLVKAWFAFVKSEEGKAVIKKAGLVTVQ
ncbi:phosphate ABC transporter substrate-binding protein PstS family protein [Caproiciproducens galactitolivorans]|uniref:phosphate ABC transporter substrate-binding protein PstS family protein n=1 Tax=Caproiciproducens galactitolivorans TaxID=642589 RepID=UPI00240A3156|nr:phosphate ABC transporter substrate-binding protein PstS family protein [Caproiciproducens galactitolivorans]